MASGEPCCLLCGDILQDSKYRRNLSHGEGLECKEMLANSLKQCLSLESEYNELLDNTFHSYLEFSDVVCKSKCFTSLHKCVRLEKDIKDLKQRFNEDERRTIFAEQIKAVLDVHFNFLDSNQHSSSDTVLNYAKEVF